MDALERTLQFNRVVEGESKRLNAAGKVVIPRRAARQGAHAAALREEALGNETARVAERTGHEIEVGHPFATRSGTCYCNVTSISHLRRAAANSGDLHISARVAA
jgi:hypothetical protein